jgi:hypothetical protein
MVEQNTEHIPKFLISVKLQEPSGTWIAREVPAELLVKLHSNKSWFKLRASSHVETVLW